jgi:hypothetical protein
MVVDGSRILGEVWSPHGVQTASLRGLASIWRPKRLALSGVFSLSMICK